MTQKLIDKVQAARSADGYEYENDEKKFRIFYRALADAPFLADGSFASSFEIKEGDITHQIHVRFSTANDQDDSPATEAIIARSLEIIEKSIREGTLQSLAKGNFNDLSVNSF